MYIKIKLMFFMFYVTNRDYLGLVEINNKIPAYYVFIHNHQSLLIYSSNLSVFQFEFVYICKELSTKLKVQLKLITIYNLWLNIYAYSQQASSNVLAEVHLGTAVLSAKLGS